jgi:FtsP/CotA-like multicopper oxidase with cupredoxin domain
MAAAADLVAEYSAKDPDETIHLSVTGHMMGGMMMDHGTAEDGIEWEDSMPMMNSMATKANTQWKIIDEASGKENMDIHYTFTKGEKIKIRIINDKDSSHPMQHPIHFHGQRFLVLSMNGVRNENLVWKDTVLVPKDATVDILLDVTNPGDWMIHCHIAEHLSNGMMGMFTVE